tara:strand:- start:1280 stop:2131 length:852 start_codon:yes stop_codon:yes gene_type:complete
MSFCYINGSYKNNIDAQISVEDRGFNFSDGVYEVMSFRRGKLLNFERHLNRLSKSLIDLQISKPFSNQKSLKIIIYHLLQLNNVYDGFLYLQITRGTARRNHLFPSKIKPNIVIFTFSRGSLDKIKKGVNIGLTKDQRWMRCDIKSISLLANVLEKQKGFEKGFFEVWQLRKKLITEGTTSNAFIVNKKSHIYTHPKNNFILGGVTRDCVVEIALENNLKVIEKAFDLDDIKNCKEAFLTSTTLGVVPVTKIDNFIINKKEVGLVTKTLMNKLEDFLDKQTYE